MEIINPSNIAAEFGLQTLEKKLKLNESSISLKIGVPKESDTNELRVSLTPSGVNILVANDHEVFVESNAGEHANFSDQEYADAGAQIVFSTEELFKLSQLIVKVSPLTPEELELTDKYQTIISGVQLGNQKAKYFDTLIEKRITGIGFEFIKDEQHIFPIVRMMHEITGLSSIQIASHYLESKQNGQGVILGGVSGIPPSTVVILGAGIIAEYAARTALGYGAQVFILDNDLTALRNIENDLNRRVITAMANTQYLTSALKYADIVIGAAMDEGKTSPVWVTNEMVQQMKAGSVIVDTVIDQGGCIETSRAQNISNPTYTEFDVIHYCVPNLPSIVARTSSIALNNVIVPFLIDIGNNGGVDQTLWSNTSLRNGTYVYRNHLTKQSLAERYNRSFRDIDMLIASSF